MNRDAANFNEYVTEDWDDLFGKDIEAFTENPASKIDLNLSETDRFNILKDALKKRKGFTYVAEKLAEKNLRNIYPRNPIEFILLYCFSCNDSDSSVKKYGIEEFRELAEALTIPKFGTQTEFTTFGELHEYVTSHKAPNREALASTLQPITIELFREITGLATADTNSETRFTELFNTRFEALVDASESIRYYTSKYLYYAICARIFEFKKLLLKFSALKPSDYLTKIYEDFQASQNNWSLETLIALNVFGMDTNNVQLSKVFLTALASSMPFTGTPDADADNINPLFLNNNGQLNEFSALNTRTSIFNSEGTNFDAKLNNKLVENIKSLKIEDFFGFKLDYGILYFFLFETIVGGDTNRLFKPENGNARENADYSDRKKDFLKNIVSGSHDVSRNALLVFFASCRAIICNAINTCDCKEYFAGYTLPLTVVNRILKRVGYPDLKEKGPGYDGLLYDFFNAQETNNLPILNSVPEYLSKWLDDPETYPVPFIINKRASENLHNGILTDKKRAKLNDKNEQ